jgi:hypothetical protein
VLVCVVEVFGQQETVIVGVLMGEIHFLGARVWLKCIHPFNVKSIWKYLSDDYDVFYMLLLVIQWL